MGNILFQRKVIYLGMIRPREHVVEDISTRIFSRNIPPEWIIRPIDKDYGLDKIVEIVELDVVTGNEFYIQLKGTENVKIVKNSITYRMNVKNLSYYMDKDLPVLLVIVDLPKENCYWLYIQSFVYNTLNNIKPNWKNQKTVTLYVPLDNDILKTHDELNRISKSGPTYLIFQKLHNIPIHHLSEWETNVEAIENLTEIRNVMREKSREIEFNISYRFEKEGDLEKSSKILQEIYDSSFASNDNENAIKAALLISYNLNPLDENQNQERMKILKSVEDFIEKSSSTSFKFLWEGIMYETFYLDFLRRFTDLRTLHLVSSQYEGDTMAPFLLLEIQKYVSALFELQTDFIALIAHSFEAKEYFASMELLRKLGMLHWSWLYHVSLGGDAVIIKKGLGVVEYLLKFSLRLGGLISDEYQIQQLLDLAIYYDSINDITNRVDSLKRATEIAERIEHKGYLQDIIRSKNRFTEPHITIMYNLNNKISKEPDQTVEISDEKEEPIIKMLLRKGGIDLDSDDEYAQLAKIGLKDRNPERILKHCEHLFTEIITYGPIWNMFSLPSTGLKILFCDKSNRSIMGNQLDFLLDGFKRDYCNSCSYHNPRAEEWKWSHRWHMARDRPETMEQIIKNFYNM